MRNQQVIPSNAKFKKYFCKCLLHTQKKSNNALNGYENKSICIAVNNKYKT